MLRKTLIGVFALTMVGIPTAQADESPSYLAVIDAGSSGTRLTLYADDPTSLVAREVTKVKTNTKGLSSFAGSPAQAGPGAITPLIEQLDTYLADQGIPKASVPISLLATAGMRNVRRDDRAAAQAILASTESAIVESGHSVADNRILPAVQEATLAWLDANGLAGTIDNATSSIGIIEIGGASAQVAFRSPVTRGAGVHVVKVDGEIIPLVAVSYLGLGGNDARSLMQRENDAGSFCFPNNNSGSAPSTYVASSDRPVNASTANYSWSRCTKAFDSTIEEVGSTRTASAGVPPSQLRTLPGFRSASFVGLGSIPFTYGDLDIQTTSNEKTALRGAATATCAGPDAWTKVLAHYAGRASTFADTLCSTATYTYGFVFGEQGVGVKPTRFTFDDSVFARSPAWTSGYATTVLDP